MSRKLKVNTRESWLKYSKDISKRYTFRKKLKLHTVDKEVCTGIHSFMRIQFYPFNHRPFPKKIDINEKIGKGPKFGINIHNQLMRYSISDDIKVSIRKHPLVDRVVKYLMEKKNIILIDGEVPVWNGIKANLATRVDLLGYHLSEKKFVIIEIKTDGTSDPEGYYEEMRGACKGIGLSMINEGLLQLVLSTIMFKKTYPDLDLTNPILVHASGKVVESYLVPNKFHLIVKNLMPLIFMYTKPISTVKNSNNKKRKLLLLDYNYSRIIIIMSG